MKNDKIVKMIMSAAVMASVVSIPALADESGEGMTQSGREKRQEEKGPGMKGEEDREEAVYFAMSVEQEVGPGMAGAKPTEPEVKEEYGPHSVSAAKAEVEETLSMFSEEDLYILAHAICGEGQCCPDDEQLYIGSVILNRRANGAYPDTIKGVVFQKGQYACTWDGNYYREPTEANWRNARWLLENGSILPDNVVYQAGFRQGSGVYLQTRYHKYCYR